MVQTVAPKYEFGLQCSFQVSSIEDANIDIINHRFNTCRMARENLRFQEITEKSNTNTQTIGFPISVCIMNIRHEISHNSVLNNILTGFLLECFIGTFHKQNNCRTRNITAAAFNCEHQQNYTNW